MVSPARLLSVISWAILAGAGYFGTRALLPRGDGNAALSQDAAQAPSPETKVAIRRDESPITTAVEWLARFQGAKGIFDQGKPVALTNWSEEELRRALEGALADPRTILPSSPVAAAFRGLTEEWLRRNPQAFVHWLDALPKDVDRYTAARAAFAVWPNEQAEAWLAFLHDHPDLREEDRRILSGDRYSKAQAQAATHGAAELAACIRSARLLSFEQPKEIELPKGFDYAAFLKTEEGNSGWSGGGAGFLVKALMKEDRDRAFDLVRQQNEDRETDFRFYEDALAHAWQPSSYDAGSFIAMMKDGGPPGEDADREHATWLGGKMALLNDAEQASLIPSLVSGMQDAVQIGNFIDALPTPESQDIARRRAVLKIYSLGVEGVMPYLEGMSSPAERFTLLETMQIWNQAKYDPVSGERVPNPPPNTELLSSKLAEWGATGEQSTRILNHLKTGWSP